MCIVSICTLLAHPQNIAKICSGSLGRCRMEPSRQQNYGEKSKREFWHFSPIQLSTTGCHYHYITANCSVSWSHWFWPCAVLWTSVPIFCLTNTEEYLGIMSTSASPVLFQLPSEPPFCIGQQKDQFGSVFWGKKDWFPSCIVITFYSHKQGDRCFGEPTAANAFMT